MTSVTLGRRITTCMLSTTLVVLLSSLALFAQGNFGRILGSVKDPTGAVLPGAGVSLIDTQRGLARTVTRRPSEVAPWRIQILEGWRCTCPKNDSSRP